MLKFSSPFNARKSAMVLSALLLMSCAREEPPAEIVIEKSPTPFHRVERGETLSAIAAKYGMTKAALIKINRLKSPYKIFIGQKLIIMLSDGSSQSRAGGKPPVKSVTNVADTGEVTVEELPAEEGKEGAAVMTPGMIPGTGAAAITPPTMGSGVPGSPTSMIGAPAGAISAGAVGPTDMAETNDMTGASPMPEAPQKMEPASAGTLKWPVQGQVIKSFGVDAKGQRNDGINIAVPAGTAVNAVDNGTVAHVGNQARGFGNLVLIKHAGGKISVYGHLQDASVKVGDTITSGQKIGTAGTSGGVSQPQVHFELRQGKTPLNPTDHLQ